MATENKKKHILDDGYKEKLAQVLSAEEMEYYGRLLEDIEDAQEARDNIHPEFDDLDYYNDYIKNHKTANSYRQRGVNKDEAALSLGTAEKKVESIFNSILQFNYKPTVMVFEENDSEIADLGDDISDIVKRTNEIENDENIMKDALRELLSQRCVYMEEYFEDGMCKKRLLNGLQIYLGDITIPYYRFKEQPYIVKYDRMQYNVAEKIYGDNENWQYVNKGVIKSENSFDYRMHKTLEENEVEIITYTNRLKKHQQILINGVMMNKMDAKLPYKHEGYNITMSGAKQMSGNFAYARPPIAQARILQSLGTQIIKSLIRKMNQSIEPPLGVKKGKIFSRDMWNPGKNTQGVKEGDFTKLIDHNGVNPSEFQMYQFIEGKIEEFISAGNLQQGLKGQGKMTATETMLLQKEGMKMLGSLFTSWILLIREMTFLRIYNILENHNKPIKQKYDNLSNKIYNIHKKFTIFDAKLDNNQIGKKIIQFTDQEITQEDNQKLYDKELEQEKLGNKIRYKLINIKQVNQIRTNFFVAVEPKEREGSELKKVMFDNQLNQAAGIMKLTGRKLNSDQIIENYERNWRVKDIFMPQEKQQQGGGGEQSPEDVNKLNSMIKDLDGGGGDIQKAGMQASGKSQKPSINTLANA